MAETPQPPPEGAPAGDVTGLLVAWRGGSREALDRLISVLYAELRRIAVAQMAGAHGVVCSGHEVRAVKTTFPNLAPLVPGIRLEGGTAHDQARVATPGRAAADGAKYLVIGRAVTAAADPAGALEAVFAEL